MLPHRTTQPFPHTNPSLPTPQKLEKKIPGIPPNEQPVHLRNRQIFSQNLDAVMLPQKEEVKS